MVVCRIKRIELTARGRARSSSARYGRWWLKESFGPKRAIFNEKKEIDLLDVGDFYDFMQGTFWKRRFIGETGKRAQ